jgi:hypothetical protein
MRWSEATARRSRAYGPTQVSRRPSRQDEAATLLLPDVYGGCPLILSTMEDQSVTVF